MSSWARVTATWPRPSARWPASSGVPSAFAGPSEVVVVADETTPVAWAAIDLVVQAEHGPDGLAWLVTWSRVAGGGRDRQRSRTWSAGRRDGPPSRPPWHRVATPSWSTARPQAMALANVVAPEHLELLVEGAEALLPLVRCAGAVFLGPYAPASVGDYVAGPNHVLPTARTARFASALRVDDFRTHIHAVALDGDTLARLAPAVATIAEAEGLVAHAHRCACGPRPTRGGWATRYPSPTRAVDDDPRRPRP